MADGDQGNNPDFNDGAGEDENVDQYFDDGGETFLPADHVSKKSLNYADLFEFESNSL
jgi:hypothetical protein